MSNNDKKLLKVFKNLTAKIDAISKEVEVVEAIKGDTGDKGDKGTQGATGHVGASGVDGKVGKVGSKGKDGSEGRTGASVTSAKIDIDGHLVLTLSDGTEIDAGELPKEEAERVINYMSGGGAPNPNIHDLPWHILEGEKKQIGDREQVAIHDVFDLEGDLVLEGSAQLVLTDPLESSGATGANGAVGADGEGVGVFQGARTKFNSDFSAPLGSSDIDWDATDYDTDSFWDISNPERLTVPAGVTRVRLTAGLHDSTSITGQMIVAIVKNGGDIYGRNEIETAGGDSASCGTPVIDVVEGDYFTSTPFLTNARTLDANTSNYLTIEVVSGDVKGSQGDKGDQGIQGDIGV